MLKLLNYVTFSFKLTQYVRYFLKLLNCDRNLLKLCKYDKDLLKFLKYIRSLIYNCFNFCMVYVVFSCVTSLMLCDKHLLKLLGCVRYLLKLLNMLKICSSLLKVVNAYPNFPNTLNIRLKLTIIIDSPHCDTLPLVFYTSFQ